MGGNRFMNIKLIYFDFPFWRAEVSRMALHIGGIPFDDVRPTGDEFRAMKNAGVLPYGQLPVLEVDGFRLGQTVAIARYCGKLSGLYPVDDDLHAARVDELLDTASQITGLLSETMREKDLEKRLALRAELASDTLLKWMTFLENRLIQNENSPMFVGAKMTVADLAVWRLLGWLTSGVLDGLPKTLLNGHPVLQAHSEHIASQPGVLDWMAKQQ
jgi:glutathione S-transferase